MKARINSNLLTSKKWFQILCACPPVSAYHQWVRMSQVRKKLDRIIILKKFLIVKLAWRTLFDALSHSLPLRMLSRRVVHQLEDERWWVSFEEEHSMRMIWMVCFFCSLFFIRCGSSKICSRNVLIRVAAKSSLLFNDLQIKLCSQLVAV